jgi:hypothetical protein
MCEERVGQVSIGSIGRIGSQLIPTIGSIGTQLIPTSTAHTHTRQAVEKACFG